MGWGESRSTAMVQRAQERITADELAAAVSQFDVRPSTGNHERMTKALDRYRDARCGLQSLNPLGSSRDSHPTRRIRT